MKKKKNATVKTNGAASKRDDDNNPRANTAQKIRYENASPMCTVSTIKFTAVKYSYADGDDQQMHPPPPFKLPIINHLIHKIFCVY